MKDPTTTINYTFIAIIEFFDDKEIDLPFFHSKKISKFVYKIQHEFENYNYPEDEDIIDFIKCELKELTRDVLDIKIIYVKNFYN